MCVYPVAHRTLQEGVRKVKDYGWTDEQVLDFVRRELKRCAAEKLAADHRATLASITPAQWAAIAKDAGEKAAGEKWNDLMGPCG